VLVAKRLTPKQERFVQALVSGASQREAYRAAYSCEKSSDKTVDNKACATLARGEVRARYDELMAELASRVLWDRERAARDLLEVREIALRHIRETKDDKKNFDDKGKRDIADLPKAAVQAVLTSTAELNRMFGIYDKPGAEGDAVPVIVDDIPRKRR
jgi:hypothetical protein